jgi:GNAT superfamily N-acetyltransferase
MSSITVAAASEAESAACIALIPQLRRTEAEFLVARRDGALVGAAGVVWRSWQHPAGFPFAVEVIPAARRQGVGRRLAAAAAQMAAGETDGIWSLSSVDESNPAAAFLRACGFEARRRQFHFEIETAAATSNFRAVAQMMRARGRIPADARMIPLAEADMEAVAWLVSAEFSTGPVGLLQRLRQGERGPGFDPARSLALMQGDRLAGVVLCSLEGRVLEVGARVVAPAWRGRWASVLQLEAIANYAYDDGGEVVRFSCDETVRDTLGVARRSGAAEVAATAHYFQAVTAP